MIAADIRRPAATARDEWARLAAIAETVGLLRDALVAHPQRDLRPVLHDLHAAVTGWLEAL